MVLQTDTHTVLARERDAHQRGHQRGQQGDSRIRTPHAARTPRRAVVRALALAALVGSALLAAPAPRAAAAEPLSVTTPYPIVAVEPGANVSFPLTITSPSPETVTLTVSGVPTGWLARLTGGGFTVGGVFATADKPATADLGLAVPPDASGTTTISIDAQGPSGSSHLALEVRITPEAGGVVTMEAAYPSLKGPSSGNFTFDVTLRNDTPRETTFALAGRGPDGWNVNVLPGGSSQATSLKVAAGATGTMSVQATPAQNVAAGVYPILVTADGNGQQAQVKLQVEITGTYTMLLTTPDQVLSTTATAGEAKAMSLVVQNSGSGILTNVKPAVTPPSGWTVTFNPTAVDSIDPGKTATIAATITPASDAVAGDYNLSFSAAAKEASDTQAIRVTVNTSLRWAIVGGALIVLVLLALGFVFRRYGRR
jgi:uncharacterized membrane protein